MRSKHRGWRLAAPLVAVAGLALAATGAGAQSPAAGGSPVAGPSIVWLEQGSGNPYWDAQHSAAAAAGKNLGFNFKAVSGELDPSKQAATLQQLADQGVNVIMLNAIDPTATAQAVQYALGKGVKVVNLYGIDPAATASIAFDEQKVGRVMAQHALGLLEQRYGEPKGTIAVLTGIQGQPASDDRAKGFTDFMAQQSGVQIVDQQPTNWSADKASSTMQDWLVKYPDLSMVYALSDTLAVPALEQADRQNRACSQQADWTTNPACIIFVAVDGIFVDHVVDGSLYATELYSPEWSGYKFAELANAVATGASFPTETDLDALLATPVNAQCVADMENAMATDTANFDFTGSLADIATARGCTLVTEGGSPAPSTAP